MKLHGNAALSWRGRRQLAQRVIEQGWTLTVAAEAAGVSVRCARKWVARYRREGEQGLFTDRGGKRRKTVGWENVHVCVDDYSRLAYVEVLEDEKQRPRSGFYSGRSRFTAAAASRSSASSPTTAAPTARRSTHSPAAHSASATSAPGPTGPKQTGKRNASSAP
jgi:transposase IS481 family protein